MKIVGFGDYLIHFSPIMDERFMQASLMQMTFTGAEANVCMALGLWGKDTRFVTKLPTHPLAQKGEMFLRGLSVDTSCIAHGEGRMGTYYLEKGQGVRASVVIYDRAPSAFTESVPSDYDWDKIFADADTLYLSGITPALSKTLYDCTKAALEEAKKRGMKVFFDVNYRPKLGDTKKAGETLMDLAPYITHLISNEEHLKMLLDIDTEYGEDDRKSRLCDLAGKASEKTGIKNIAITVRRTPSASKAVVYAAYTDGKDFELSPEYALDVVDRVGSGDAFSAGLIYAQTSGWSVKDSVAFASASSAMKHMIVSDVNFASVDEIKTVMQGNRYDVKR